MTKDWRKELDELNAIMNETKHQSDKVHIALKASYEKRKKRFTDEDVKSKKSNSLKKSWQDPQTHEKRTNSNIASRTNEVREKIGSKLTGIKRGIPSNEHKVKLSNTLKGIPKLKITCPHCGTEGGEGIMKRWHFDNCKHKL